ncbi:MAG: HNH endonuclease [Anaerolineae bacterium]|nr:HNH endonuclease [Anaerolineae bacterium]
MPVRRRRRARYPSAWPQIAARVKAAAGWRCAHCGHAHDPATRHTLTVHHLDGDPGNCADANLVALCQRCHLHVQALWRPGDPLPAAWDGPPAWLTRRGLPFAPRPSAEASP